MVQETKKTHTLGLQNEEDNRARMGNREGMEAGEPGDAEGALRIGFLLPPPSSPLLLPALLRATGHPFKQVC